MTTDLDRLLLEIRACRACAGEFAHQPRPVVRVSPKTRILICGQAPGRRVHDSGLPFDDPSGDRLREWMGVDRTVFYDHPAIGVAAMAFCYPGTAPDRGGDYPPPAKCARLWRARLLGQLRRVELTLLVGSYAQAWALGDAATMTERVRGWRDLAPNIIPLPHPSWRNSGWLKRHPWFELETAPYLRTRVAQILGA